MVDAFAFVADNISVTAMVRDRGIPQSESLERLMRNI
ncbi:hypothetical protein IMSAGC019_04033 [Lachnospiraceae bacterium]|jgi:hypothetical protein|nr:hypothetical protein IMSAGC009_02119 [Lachnospiraceae bacterium]GFI48696.1 hypothetical protein IMSAGC019_04033 [Lachnospiraceae bacterium]